MDLAWNQLQLPMVQAQKKDLRGISMWLKHPFEELYLVKIGSSCFKQVKNNLCYPFFYPPILKTTQTGKHLLGDFSSTSMFVLPSEHPQTALWSSRAACPKNPHGHLSRSPTKTGVSHDPPAMLETAGQESSDHLWIWWRIARMCPRSISSGLQEFKKQAAWISQDWSTNDFRNVAIDQNEGVLK